MESDSFVTISSLTCPRLDVPDFCLVIQDCLHFKVNFQHLSFLWNLQGAKKAAHSSAPVNLLSANHNEWENPLTNLVSIFHSILFMTSIVNRERH